MLINLPPTCYHWERSKNSNYLKYGGALSSVVVQVEVAAPVAVVVVLVYVLDIAFVSIDVVVEVLPTVA